MTEIKQLSSQGGSSDTCCQQYAGKGHSSVGYSTVKRLVVGIGDDVQNSSVGLLACRLDLILRKLKPVCPIVSQLKDVS